MNPARAGGAHSCSRREAPKPQDRNPGGRPAGRGTGFRGNDPAGAPRRAHGRRHLERDRCGSSSTANRSRPSRATSSTAPRPGTGKWRHDRHRPPGPPAAAVGCVSNIRNVSFSQRACPPLRRKASTRRDVVKVGPFNCSSRNLVSGTSARRRCTKPGATGPSPRSPGGASPLAAGS